MNGVASIMMNAFRGRTNLQQNAQANVPVIPNNGNPGGVHNMPAPTLPAQPQAAPPAPAPTAQPVMAPTQNKYFYPWMNPSPAMQQVYQMLGRRAGMRDEMAMNEQPQMDPLRREMILPQRR